MVGRSSRLFEGLRSGERQRKRSGLWADAAKPCLDEDERMSDVKFSCPQCGTRLAVNVGAAGMTVSCPNCSQSIAIPQTAGELGPDRTVSLGGPPAGRRKSARRCWFFALAAVGVLAVGLCAGILIERSTRGGAKPGKNGRNAGPAGSPVRGAPETNSVIAVARPKEVGKPVEPQRGVKPPDEEASPTSGTASQIGAPLGLTAQSMTNLFHTTFENGDLSDWRFTDARGQVTSPPGWQALREADGRWVLEGKGHNWANLAARHDWGDFVLRVRLRVLQGGLHLNYRINSRGRYFIGFNTNDIAVLKSYFTGLPVADLDRTLQPALRASGIGSRSPGAAASFP